VSNRPFAVGLGPGVIMVVQLVTFEFIAFGGFFHYLVLCVETQVQFFTKRVRLSSLTTRVADRR